MADLLQQLKALKHDPRAGATVQSEHAAEKAKLLLAIGHDGVQAENSPVEAASPVYFRWYLRNLISRPVAIGVSGFVLLTSGWMTTVSAAADSLPGDALYSIKLVTERAQIELASLDRRAVLHTEFAERRLKEVSELQRSEVAGLDPALVRGAVDAYKQELASANANLVELQGSSQQGTVEAAGEVQERISALEVKIDTAVNDATNPTTPEVLEVQESTREAGNAAVDVAVEATQQSVDVAAPDSEQSQQKLEEVFHREIGAIHARQAFDMHRVDTIKAALATYRDSLNAIDTLEVSDLSVLHRTIDQAIEVVPDAMDDFSRDDYREAFDLLRVADAELLAVELRLAEIEIEITNAISAQANLTADQVELELNQVDVNQISDQGT